MSQSKLEVNQIEETKQISHAYYQIIFFLSSDHSHKELFFFFNRQTNLPKSSEEFTLKII